MKKKGIDSRIVFYPIHTQPIYQQGLALPVAEKIHQMGISLPSAPEIFVDEIKATCDIVKLLSVNKCLDH